MNGPCSRFHRDFWISRIFTRWNLTLSCKHSPFSVRRKNVILLIVKRIKLHVGKGKLASNENTKLFSLNTLYKPIEETYCPLFIWYLGYSALRYKLSRIHRPSCGRNIVGVVSIDYQWPPTISRYRFKITI